MHGSTLGRPYYQKLAWPLAVTSWVPLGQAPCYGNAPSVVGITCFFFFFCPNFCLTKVSLPFTFDPTQVFNIETNSNFTKKERKRKGKLVCPQTVDILVQEP